MLPQALALCAEPSQQQARELERDETLLHDALSDLAPNSGVTLLRVDDRVTLRFSTALIFETDSSALKPDAGSSAPVAATLRLLKHRRGLSAQILVYTDSIGSESANQSFSAARAKALCALLSAQGINALRLRARGVGETDPLSSNSMPEGRTENRRVEIAFVSPAK